MSYTGLGSREESPLFSFAYRYLPVPEFFKILQGILNILKGIEIASKTLESDFISFKLLQGTSNGAYHLSPPQKFSDFYRRKV
jgi:hypothetical protein